MPILRKLTVDKYEKEFETDKLRDKHIFYDLNVRVGDPEELRSTCVELLEDSDFTVSLNEMTKFEDKEFEKMFWGGRLKPLKSVIKANKDIKKGVKYPLLWKVLLMVGIASLVIFFFPESFRFNRTAFLYIAVSGVILSWLIFMIKKVVPVAVWFKIIGIYNVSDEKTDVRLVLAADSLKKDKEAFNRLENELSEIYSIIAKKYVNKISKRELTQNIKIETTKSEKPEVKVLSLLNDIDKEINKLERGLLDNKISEKTYRELKGKLGRKRSKLETLYDLLNV